MIYGKVGILLILAFVSLITTPIALGSSLTAPIVYVAGDGSGDYNCDGINDQVEINDAINYVAEHDEFTTVHLNGANTYWIDGSILLRNYMILEGDSDAVVKLVDNAAWERKDYGLIDVNGTVPGGDGVDNVTIRGFKIDGNRDNQPELTGRGYYNAIKLRRGWNIEIYDMDIRNNLGDGILIDHSVVETDPVNIDIHDNIIYETGHDGIYLKRLSNATIYNNRITCNVNSGIRTYDTNHVIINNNTIDANYHGGAGVQIGKSGVNVVDDVEIYDNKIYHTALWGILVNSRGDSTPETSKAHIYNNLIYGTGTSHGDQRTAGICVYGFNTIIENNVLDYNKKDAIHSAVDKNVENSGTGFVTVVRNNIITNTRAYSYGEEFYGYGIRNDLPETHSYVIEYNSFFNNPGGNFVNVNLGTGNIYTDPQYVNPAIDDSSAASGNNDYHLKSTVGRYSNGIWVTDESDSACIDAGNPSSDYSNEPGNNGDRINIGRYGNTAEASRSVSNQPTASAGPDRTVTVGEIVILDGSASSDDVGIVSYVWDFDDSDGLQQDATGAVVQHSYSAAGTYTATLTVTDAIGNTDSDITLITVNAVNYAPVMNFIGAKSVEEESTLSFTVSASDADVDSLTYSATDLPSGASIDSSTGAFSWTPSDSQSGIYSVTFEVTDGQAIDSEEVTITVNGIPATAPSLVYDNRLRESSPDTTLAGNYYIDIGNNDGVVSYRDVIWFDLTAYNTTDTVSSATLSLYWYYPSTSPRNQDTVVEVYRPSDWSPGQVSWNNKAASTPWNNAGGDWFDTNNVAQGSTPYASITFDANDLPDDRYYEFDITELVQDYVSGEYDNTGLFLKAQNEYDNYIAFYSSDWSNEDQRPKLTITHTQDTEPVNNNAPVLNSIGSRTVEVGNSLSFMVSATDADDDILTYSAAGLPGGASFDSVSGEFTWTPSEGQTGTYVVTSEVTDGYLADSEAFTITVNAAYPRWDVNKDGIVNILDITLVGQNIGTSAESGPRCDVNQDGLINILDLTVVGQNFGKTVN